MENIIHDKKKLTILGIIAAILFGICYYFFYWIKTPVYSLGLIGDACKTHDVEKFQKHVDLDTLLPQMVDDVFVAYGINNRKTDNAFANALLAGFVQVLKPAIVNGLKTEIIANVKGVEEKNKPMAFNKDVNESSKNIINRMSFASFNEKQDVKNIKTVSQDGNTAIVSADVFDKKVKKYHTVKLKMNKLDDGTWKISTISNGIDLFTEVDKDQQEVLAKYDRFQKSEIKKAIQVVKVVGHAYLEDNIFFKQYKLNIFSKIKNISGKPIKNAYVSVTVYNKYGPEINKTSEIENTGKLEVNGEKEGFISMELNPFIPEENAMNKLDRSQLGYGANIHYIKFEDGTVLERPKGINDVPDDFIK